MKPLFLTLAVVSLFSLNCLAREVYHCSNPGSAVGLTEVDFTLYQKGECPDGWNAGLDNVSKDPTAKGVQGGGDWALIQGTRFELDADGTDLTGSEGYEIPSGTFDAKKLVLTLKYKFTDESPSAGKALTEKFTCTK